MSASNENYRVETFSDGVFAIAITLLILDIKVPPLESMHSTADVWHAIGKLWPSFFALGFSFTIILISWIAHHSLLRTLDKTSPQFQLANGFFLFTVIFIPFPTAFMAEYLDTEFAQPAIVFYCMSTVLTSIGWNLLYRSFLKPVSLVKASVGTDHIKNSSRSAKYGLILYLSLTILAWWFPYVALAISVLTWAYWLYYSFTFKGEK